MYKQQKTVLLKKEQVQRSWLLIDAAGKTLGRLASEIAKMLRGKHKPDYTPHVDSGDGVIVINAEKIEVTGRKEAQKIYRHYTGFTSGMREIPYRDLMKRDPTQIITRAVGGMVPRTKQGKGQMKRLRVYKGDHHDLSAQQPIKVNV